MIAARLASALEDIVRSPLAKSGADTLDRMLSKRQVTLDAAIDADRHEIRTADAGTLSYYADTRAGGRPVVLLHGIHAAASSYEMRPLFEAFRTQRSVYALDLPGFGFSERSSQAYTPATYVHAIEHLLRQVSTREPVDVIALSLTSEYAAKVAVEMPEMVRSLVLISPTGFSSAQETGRLERFSRRVKSKLPSQLSELAPSRLLYELLVSKPSLQYYLKRSFETRVDPGLLAYTYATSHQPGAWRAPMSFVSGGLFTRGSALNLYAHVHAPALVLYDQDAHTSFGELDAFVDKHDNYTSQRLSHTRGLPQFDAPQRTFEALQGFFDRLDPRKGKTNVRPIHNGRVLGSA